jgi:hypothetical protein
MIAVAAVSREARTRRLRRLEPGTATPPKAERAAGRRTLRTILGHPGAKNVVDGTRKPRLSLARSRHGVLEMGVDHRDVTRTPKGHVSRQALIEQTRKGIHVGATVDLLVANLLGGDVVDRSDHLLRICHRTAVGCARTEPEIGEITVLLAGDEDIRRLHVSMNETPFMCSVERGSDLFDDRERALGLKRSVTAQKRAKVGAGDVAHRDVEELPEFARLVDRDDVRMVERRSELRLAEEPLAKGIVFTQLRREELQRNLSLQAKIVCAVDDAHPAAPEDALEVVLAEVRSDAVLRQDRHAARVRRVRCGD